jgi:hypothetical protein
VNKVTLNISLSSFAWRGYFSDERQWPILIAGVNTKGVCSAAVGAGGANAIRSASGGNCGMLSG